MLCLPVLGWREGVNVGNFVVDCGNNLTPTNHPGPIYAPSGMLRLHRNHTKSTERMWCQRDWGFDEMNAIDSKEKFHPDHISSSEHDGWTILFTDFQYQKPIPNFLSRLNNTQKARISH